MENVFMYFLIYHAISFAVCIVISVLVDEPTTLADLMKFVIFAWLMPLVFLTLLLEHVGNIVIFNGRKP